MSKWTATVAAEDKERFERKAAELLSKEILSPSQIWSAGNGVFILSERALLHMTADTMEDGRLHFSRLGAMQAKKVMVKPGSTGTRWLNVTFLKNPDQYGEWVQKYLKQGRTSYMGWNLKKESDGSWTMSWRTFKALLVDHVLEDVLVKGEAVGGGSGLDALKSSWSPEEGEDGEAEPGGPVSVPECTCELVCDLQQMDLSGRSKMSPEGHHWHCDRRRWERGEKVVGQQILLGLPDWQTRVTLLKRINEEGAAA